MRALDNISLNPVDGSEAAQTVIHISVSQERGQSGGQRGIDHGEETEYARPYSSNTDCCKQTPSSLRAGYCREVWSAAYDPTITKTDVGGRDLKNITFQ